MGFGYRVKRLVREAIGLQQWPRRGAARPRNFEQQIYSAVVREGDTCFDVGANVGDVALYLARVAGPSGCIVAFEPLPSVYCDLCRHLQCDNYEKAPVVTIPMGLSDEVRSATISIPAQNFFRGSLAPFEQWRRVQSAAAMSSCSCDFTTFDAVLESNKYRIPDFVKIDVEGAELLVLRGASASFDNGFRPIMLIELFAPWESAFGYVPWDVLSYLQRLDYRFLFACPDGLVEHEPSLKTPVPSEYEKGDTVVAFLPDSHADRLERLRALQRGSAALPMTPPPYPNRVA